MANIRKLAAIPFRANQRITAYPLPRGYGRGTPDRHVREDFHRRTLGRVDQMRRRDKRSVGDGRVPHHDLLLVRPQRCDPTRRQRPRLRIHQVDPIEFPDRRPRQDHDVREGTTPDRSVHGLPQAERCRGGVEAEGILHMNQQEDVEGVLVEGRLRPEDASGPSDPGGWIERIRQHDLRHGLFRPVDLESGRPVSRIRCDLVVSDLLGQVEEPEVTPGDRQTQLEGVDREDLPQRGPGTDQLSWSHCAPSHTAIEGRQDPGPPEIPSCPFHLRRGCLPFRLGLGEGRGAGLGLRLGQERLLLEGLVPAVVQLGQPVGRGGRLETCLGGGHRRLVVVRLQLHQHRPGPEEGAGLEGGGHRLDPGLDLCGEDHLMPGPDDTLGAEGHGVVLGPEGLHLGPDRQRFTRRHRRPHGRP